MRTTYSSRQTDSSITPFPALARFFEDVLNTHPYRTDSRERKETWRPTVDIYEQAGNLVIRAEVPGVNEKEIDLHIEGNLLTLRGERKPEDRNNYYLQENTYGSFSRSFTLPESVDREKIKADYKNGILTVTIPQKAEVKPRAIPVSLR